MADVAAKAGVVRATVFNYFPSKHALVEAITGDVIAYWDAMLERALASESTPVPTLVRALFDHMGFGIEQYHGFYKGVFREIMKMRVGLEEGGEVEATSWRAFGRLTALLARGQERGEITRAAHAADLAAAFDALSNGTIHHWLFDGTEGSLRERMNRAAEIFLGPVAVGRDAPAGPLPDLFPPPSSGASRALERALPRARRATPRRTRR
jgi:AcrR family transcriptional regulator